MDLQKLKVPTYSERRSRMALLDDIQQEQPHLQATN